MQDTIDQKAWCGEGFKPIPDVVQVCELDVILPAYMVYTSLLKQRLRIELELTNMLNYKASTLVETEVLDQEHLPVAWPVAPVAFHSSIRESG